MSYLLEAFSVLMSVIDGYGASLVHTLVSSLDALLRKEPEDFRPRAYNVQHNQLELSSSNMLIIVTRNHFFARPFDAPLPLELPLEPVDALLATVLPLVGNVPEEP